jgi:hypothetical protein
VSCREPKYKVCGSSRGFILGQSGSAEHGRQAKKLGWKSQGGNEADIEMIMSNEMERDLLVPGRDGHRQVVSN